MELLYDKLNAYRDSDYYGFHMPGHKRNERLMDNGLPYGIDITEIEGFDDLHHADGILRDSQQRAASLYGAGESHFLINGSTVGILSAVLGSTRRGDKVLVARNCHKSVYHAIFLNELEPVYVYPQFHKESKLNTEISVSAVQTALKEHSDIRAAILVSPTYEGVISDVKGIAEEVHRREIPLIVDEAHGAHLGFHPYFPENANRLGADLVVHSLHKTLPSLTQTALLHINGELVERARVRRYLDMLQSSSPSYVLLSSIDACIAKLEEENARFFDSYVEALRKLRRGLRKLRRLQILETEHFDRSKVVISVKNADISSRDLYHILLRDYHLQMEMAAGSYVLAMTAPGDTREGFGRLFRALFEIDEEMDKRMRAREISGARRGEETDEPAKGRIQPGDIPRLERAYTSAEIYRMAEKFSKSERRGERKRIPWEESAGHISMEYAYLYPPGSPLLVPGEKISEDVIDLLCYYRAKDFRIEGLKEEGYIEVWING